MSFFFKSKKHQNSGLPQATRETSSSHGAGSQIPTANGFSGAPRGPAAASTTPGSSVNNSMSSVTGNTASPEPRIPRDRADSDATVPFTGPLQNGRNNALTSRAPGESPYPWSQTRLSFTQSTNPFPRYGIAVNANASKDGAIYLMGGLVSGSVVKGDLWIVESASNNMACYPVGTAADGPCPRVGHASLLVGNAFIVFGGDTKVDEGDTLDDTLYLLNTSTKQWSRSQPAGTRPAGRYGHTLNILESKIYVFGGQVEGYFFNDLVAFDLNSLQSSTSRWEVLIPNSEGSPNAPPARTNHSIVSWNGRLYLFGGTDGERWFSDVWTYEPRSNSWMELDCIGYIPAPREGHSASLVGDTMYIFGGRTREGNDLGDLAAFKISSRRWYMFQNMGPSPSPRSGHSMTSYGKHVVVLGGEPSTAPRDPGELSLAYVLDTSKIRYPPSDPPPAANDRQAVRKTSSERSAIPQSNRNAPRESVMAVGGFPRAAETNIPPPGGSRLPRASSAGPPSGPPPQQQAPQPKTNGATAVPRGPRAKTPTRGEREAESKEPSSPVAKEAPVTREAEIRTAAVVREQSPSGQPSKNPYRTESFDSQSTKNTPSRSGSRSTRQQSVERVEHGSPRQSSERARSRSRQGETRPAEARPAEARPAEVRPAEVRPAEVRQVETAAGTSAVPAAPTEELTKELEAARNRNAWYASELALARKQGYLPNPSNNPILDERAADAFGDSDRPFIEALLSMRGELARVQGSIEAQATAAANKIAEIEKQRDAAIDEAVYAKAKLVAHGGSQAGTPQPDSGRGGSPDLDRINDLNRRLASALNAQAELSSKVTNAGSELDTEKKARKIAEETAEAAQKRVTDLDLYRQQNAAELERLRSELHEVQKTAREESARANDAESSSRLLAVDKNELAAKLASAQGDHRSRTTILEGLKEAVTSSTERSSHLELKLDEEKAHRDSLEQKLAQLRAEHEHRTAELETTTARLRDAEELAERNAEEARLHRQVVMSGFGKVVEKEEDDTVAVDERVTILQQQVESANAMVRANQEAADSASEKLRRAEERIAGLEAYQEQSSRESLTVRKQLQSSMKELQTVQAEKADLHQRLERHLLESNAVEVQLKTLKNLLEERGVSASDSRRSRAMGSPGPRLGTPDMERLRELEQQLDASLKSHEELRSTFEQREQGVHREWEMKLEALDNDHQAAVKYLRGTEKMLTKMKSELQRYKTANAELERELATHKAAADDDAEDQEAAWEHERATLHQNIVALEANVQSSVQALEGEIDALKAELADAHDARDAADEQHRHDLELVAAQHRVDADRLRADNDTLDARAREAEHRVQMFLDQFESSVDNYRRESRMHTQKAVGLAKGDPRSSIAGGSPGAGASVNGMHAGVPHHHHSISGHSMYSETSTRSRSSSGSPTAHTLDHDHDPDDDDPDTDTDAASGAGTSTPDAAALSAQATRNSFALDSLATELDALRSHWETTSKHYRLSDRFDAEGRTPTAERPAPELAGSAASSVASSSVGSALPAWRRRAEGEAERSASSASRATPTAATAAGGVI